MHRAGDGERLPFAAGKPADQAVAVIDAGDAEFLHRLHGDFVGFFAVVDPEGPETLGGFCTDEEGAADAHQRKGSAELVHGGNAHALRIARPVEIDRLSIHQHFAGTGLVDAGQRLDQRGFSSSIVAKQAEHLAGAHLQ